MKSQGFLVGGLIGVLSFAFHPMSSAQHGQEHAPDMSHLKAASEAKMPAKSVAVSTLEGYFDNLESAKKEPSKVVRLNLQGHSLKSVPTDLCLFPNLKELDLSHNRITSLSVDFQCPSQLKKLYLNDNQITELPARLGQLTQLETLVAHNNPITRIDPAIGAMHHLKELWLSGNGNTSSFQPAIWNLTGLETLRLWEFGLLAVPDAIGHLQHLKTLCLAHNRIQSLNAKVCTLPLLEYLNLGDNALQVIPADIRYSTRLGYLGIYENPITSLPDDFVVLSKSLERLSAWDTGLSSTAKEQLSRSFDKTTIMFEADRLH